MVGIWPVVQRGPRESHRPTENSQSVTVIIPLLRAAGPDLNQQLSRKPCGGHDLLSIGKATIGGKRVLPQLQAYSPSDIETASAIPARSQPTLGAASRCLCAAGMFVRELESRIRQF
jgi:hypothetical protein